MISWLRFLYRMRRQNRGRIGVGILTGNEIILSLLRECQLKSNDQESSYNFQTITNNQFSIEEKYIKSLNIDYFCIEYCL